MRAQCARLLSRSPWSGNAVRVLAGTGGEWPGARRLFAPDRAWAGADLQRRRHRQPGARRVLRAWRLSIGRNHEISRLRFGCRDFAARRGVARHPVRAVHPAPLLYRRSDPEPARHLRSCHGRGAGDPHHMGRGAVVGVDPPAFRGSVFLGDFLFSRYRLLILAVVAAVLLGVWLLLHKTSFGRVVRAGIQRPDMVAALGIRLQPYMTAIVMLGVGMAALGGAFFAPITIVHPAMGAEIITVAFVVVVIGGLGSFWGVVIAALLVGVVRGITIHFAPAAGEASIYVLMFLVLLVRPRGLLGERIEKFE